VDGQGLGGEFYPKEVKARDRLPITAGHFSTPARSTAALRPAQATPWRRGPPMDSDGIHLRLEGLPLTSPTTRNLKDCAAVGRSGVRTDARAWAGPWDRPSSSSRDAQAGRGAAAAFADWLPAGHRCAVEFRKRVVIAMPCSPCCASGAWLSASPIINEPPSVGGDGGLRLHPRPRTGRSLTAAAELRRGVAQMGRARTGLAGGGRQGRLLHFDNDVKGRRRQGTRRRDGCNC